MKRQTYSDFVPPPSVKPEESACDRDGIERSHPAFGMIGAHRYSGGDSVMFGSPIRHNGGVQITVYEATERLHLHQSWYHAKGHGTPVASLRMSEAQWAAFVSTMNMGDGVPCTLEYVRSGRPERMPYIDDDHLLKKAADEIGRSVAEREKAMTAALAALDGLLAQPTIRKGDLAKVRSMFTQPGDHAASNAKFLADSLTEHVHDAVTAGKAELSAMATRLAMQFPQLESAARGPAMIEDKTGE